MPRNKPYSQKQRPQNRRAILEQSTSETEPLDRSTIEQNSNDTKGSGSHTRGRVEVVEPVNRAMFPSESKIPWDMLAFCFAVLLALIAFIWYLASQDSAIKNLTDDSKQLKESAEESTRFMIKTGVRLDNVEQRITDIEQHDKSNERSVAVVVPPAPKNQKK